MKFKTWEKIYWVVIACLLGLAIITFHTKGGEVNIKGVKRPMTTNEFYLGIFILYGIFGALLWLVIRYFVNKEKKD